MARILMMIKKISQINHTNKMIKRKINLLNQIKINKWINFNLKFNNKVNKKICFKITKKTKMILVFKLKYSKVINNNSKIIIAAVVNNNKRRIIYYLIIRAY